MTKYGLILIVILGLCGFGVTAASAAQGSFMFDENANIVDFTYDLIQDDLDKKQEQDRGITTGEKEKTFEQYFARYVEFWDFT